MEVNKKELRRLAEDAEGSFGSFDPSEAEQDFMAEISPAAILSLLDENDQLRAENERLRALLLEASEEIDSWGSYASEYFQKRHDLPGAVAKFHDAAMAKEVDNNAH